uniref:Endoplasmic reticulum resident protein 44 n=1 Tax=Cacopsylla melanoneura TaxID=428564 RepID=A0A8D8L7Y0_9HEMI
MDLSIFQALLSLGLILTNLLDSVESQAHKLTSDNFDKTLADHELVIINFYADWCRFSNILAPVFDDAAKKVSEEFASTPNRVVLGKVDCDNENAIATRFHVTKYPTLKVIRNGQPAKKEYRGQRSADAFLTFVRDQLEDPITEFHALAELKDVDSKKGHLIGYFDTKEQVQYDVFRRVASMYKDDCKFYAGFGDAVRSMHPPNEPIIVFRPDVTTPLEELTEEGLPFLILFYTPGDTETIKLFKSIVSDYLLGEKQNINFLTADGERFAHPLHHLGKSKADLPLIAIDSFRHMYIFPDTKQMTDPRALKQFIQDLYSGKLHREFHYGPETENMLEAGGPTSPPESTFRKLAPSRNRYTLLKDEL